MRLLVFDVTMWKINTLLRVNKGHLVFYLFTNLLELESLSADKVKTIYNWPLLCYTCMKECGR